MPSPPMTAIRVLCRMRGILADLHRSIAKSAGRLARGVLGLTGGRGLKLGLRYRRGNARSLAESAPHGLEPPALLRPLDPLGYHLDTQVMTQLDNRLHQHLKGPVPVHTLDG